MPFKTFTTRRQWHNTLLMAWMFPFLTLIGVLFLAVRGLLWITFAFVALALLGLVVALVRDLGRRCYYSIRSNVMTLRSGSHEFQFDLDEVIDASLIDRMAARDYIKTKVSVAGVKDSAERKSRMKEFVRFSTVDIGLHSFTLGMGRSVIDRLPLAKNDLVLLRLRSGRDLLLSPKYNQDLMDSVSRSIRQRPA